ncbi:hypothetical protein V8B97DRAFT_1950794 [Scleroderma yunnanense]
MYLSFMVQARIGSQTLLRHAGFARVSARNNSGLPVGFTLFPNFLDTREQCILLASALSQLDALESKRIRKQQKQQRHLHTPSRDSVESVFLPERFYTFQSGHYDSVIRDYREMHLTSWCESEAPGLPQILNRLRAMCPSQNTQTHILHLASTGAILPHIDNVFSSGTWILGVSLGATRVLQIEKTDAVNPHNKLDIALSSGSVYLQRDDVRYHWKHAILPHQSAVGGQRVSVIIRDRQHHSPVG